MYARATTLAVRRPPRLTTSVGRRHRIAAAGDGAALARLLWPSPTLTAARRAFSIPAVEPLTRRGVVPGESPSRTSSFTGEGSPPVTGSGHPLVSSAYVRARGTDPPGHPSAASGGSSHLSFAVSDAQRGLLDHGLSPAATEFVAEAEAAYRASSAYLHTGPGGAALPEAYETVDPKTGAVTRRTVVAAPVGETYVPSRKAHHAVRGTVGELEYQAATGSKFLLDARAQLNLRKERQLEELLAAPMPMIAKAEEVVQMLGESFYTQALALQPRNAETTMAVLGQASLLRRLEGLPEPVGGVRGGARALGRTAADDADAAGGSTPLPPPSVPFLSDMRRLYAHQKSVFAAPTPLTVEHVMSALSAVTEPNQQTFQLANRLLLDCDRFVVLPTRTTYAAYFAVCRVNDAVVPFAVARLRDAVVSLRVSLDAPMATELLRGLNENGYVDEAVALLARIEQVPMTTPLMNACLETLLLSRQASACFAAHASVRSAALQPNADTYTLLLLACEQSGDWSRVTAVLADMQRRRVRGNAQTLNLLLKGLLTQKLDAYAVQLHATMREKGVGVWPALEEGIRRVSAKTLLSTRPRRPNASRARSDSS